MTRNVTVLIAGFVVSLTLVVTTCGQSPSPPTTPPSDVSSLALVRQNLPELPGPLTGADVTLEALLETVDRLHEQGLISDDGLHQIQADPEGALERMREMIDNPERFGVDEERLRRRGGEIADRFRHLMSVEGMSAEEAEEAVKRELRR